MDVGLSRRDLLRFYAVYRRQTFAASLSKSFWEKVHQNARKMYFSFHSKPAPPMDR
jgi:hypothetical protein